MESVPKFFQNQYCYNKIWRPILEAEKKQQEENTKKCCMLSDGEVTLEPSKYNLKMKFVPSDDIYLGKKRDLPTWWKFKMGDTVEVQEESKEFESDEDSEDLEYESKHQKVKWVGHIFQVPNHRTNEFGIKLDSEVMLNKEAKFKVTLAWNPEIFHRMGRALTLLRYTNESNSDQKYLIHALHNRIQSSKYYDEPAATKKEVVSFDKRKIVPSPMGILLDENQLTATTMGLEKRLLLVQGAAGTGKTTVLIETSYQMIKQHENVKILMCAQSNGAVDLLALKLKKLDIRVTRYYSRSCRLGNNRSPASHLGLIEQMLERCPELQEDYKRFYCQRTERKRLESKREFTDEKSERDERNQFWQKYDQVRDEVWKYTQVVCCTCVSPGGKEFKDRRFDVVMIDDANQATELECNIAIFGTGAPKVILAGDLQQLSPVVDSKIAKLAGLQKSLFGRLMEQNNGGIPTIELEIQYRMHPMLSEFPNMEFYEGNITNGVEAEDRELKFSWLPAKKDKCIIFINVDSEEDKTGESRYNNNEAQFAVDLLCKIVNSDGVSPDKIALITPYEAQRQMINNKLRIKLESDWELSSSIAKTEISSFNSYQGKDNDVVISTFARANNSTSDFLADPGKLNLALTRANYKLILVGHYDTLVCDKTCKKLLKFIDRHGSRMNDWEINL